jgi:hypothetical protein
MQVVEVVAPTNFIFALQHGSLRWPC